MEMNGKLGLLIIKEVKMKKLNFYKVKLKREKKLKTYYVHTENEFEALNLAVRLLSNSLDLVYQTCRDKYHGQEDNFTITKIEV